MLASCGGNTEKKNADQTAPQQTDAAVADTTTNSNGTRTSASGREQGDQMPRVIDFWAEWCQPCKIMKPVFTRLEKEYDGRVAFEAISVDEDEEMAADYDITAIPTFIFIDSNGREVSRLVGVVDEQEMRESLNAIAK